MKNEVFMVIDEYYKKYKLPPQNISEHEWDSFFKVLEAHFLAHNKMDDYVHAVNIVVRQALSYASFDQTDFNIEHLKKALSDLCAFNIFSDEVDAIREEITEKTKRKALKK